MTEAEKFDHPPAADADRFAACMERNKRLREALAHLHDFARGAGYEDATHALESLAASRELLGEAEKFITGVSCDGSIARSQRASAWLVRYGRTVSEKRKPDESQPGTLEIGLSLDMRDVVINHPELVWDARGGHMVFSPEQARGLAALLISKAEIAEGHKA